MPLIFRGSYNMYICKGKGKR